MIEAQAILDGDAGFTGVNDRDHPSRLGPGIVAEGQNVRFDRGDPEVRWVANVGVWGHAQQFGNANLLAAARWFEPETGEESIVVLTDGVRSSGDGGTGQAWKVLPGGAPLEIPLNGYDVWARCRLVPARSGLVLLRRGQDRHYIPVGNVTEGSDTVTFNVAHGWSNGDQVTVRAMNPVAPPLQADTSYYFKSLTSTTGELYTDSALSTAVTFEEGAELGAFALERNAAQPGPGGNGAPPLILEPAWGSGTATTAWDNGFQAVPTNVACSVAHEGSEWTAENHRLSNGQTVELGDDWDVSTPSDPTTIAAGTDLYAYVIDNHHVSLHTTAEDALLGTNALVDSTNTADGLTSTLRPVGYSGQPIVPLHEAVYVNNRLVGLNGLNNVAVSDPGDLLHFTPYEGAKTAAVGNGDPLTTLVPMGEAAVLLISKSQVLALQGLSQSSSNWTLTQVTQEYGSDSPLAVFQVGRDVWLLSRNGNGVMSVRQTDYGLNQGAAVPVSLPLNGKFSEVDWDHADQACAAWFDNKALIAVPLKDQIGTPVNNCLLVYNFITQGWDGYWQGDAIQPRQFFRANIGGSEKLCWIDEDGSVKWFTDGGWEDLTLAYSGGEWVYGSNAVDAYAVTRGYTGGSAIPKRWQELELVVATINPSLSVTAITEGVNEETTYRSAITKDATQWLIWNQADYDPDDEPSRAALPYREDYSLIMGEAGGLLLPDAGVPADAHQAQVMRVPIRERCRMVQLKLRCTQGSARWRSVWLKGVEDRGA